MAANKQVQRRSDKKVFWSAGDAGASVGRPGVRISTVCRAAEKGLYAMAYGDQWRYWRPGNMPAWPEKPTQKQKKERRIVSAKHLHQFACATMNCDPKCPANFEGTCPFLAFARLVASFIAKRPVTSTLETIQNERQTTDGLDSPPASEE